jgi:hypothetical protein
MKQTFLPLQSMSSSPVARLQSLSDEEKEKLSAVLRRRLFFRSGIFFAMVLTCVAIILYFNIYNDNHVNDNLEIVNVVFVVISVLCARLFVSEFLEYKKEISSPVKKLVQTRVAGKKDGKIILGNKSFGKDDILLDASEFDSLRDGDEVILELSAKSNTIFSIRRILKQG